MILSGRWLGLRVGAVIRLGLGGSRGLVGAGAGVRAGAWAGGMGCMLGLRLHGWGWG